MNIIHVGNFPCNKKASNLCGVGSKISNGFIRNGHNVLNISDRYAARTAGFGHRRFGIGHANRLVKELCLLQKPDLLLLGHADIIKPETLLEIKKNYPDIRMLQWNVDPVFEEDNINRIKKKLDIVDATLVSTAGEALRPLYQKGKKLGFLPNPVDSSIEVNKNFESDTLPYDFFYACGNPTSPLRYALGKFWNMNEFIEILINKCPSLKALLPGLFNAPKLNGIEYKSILGKTSIGLNISRRPDYFLYSSDRIAHLMGNGIATCIESGTGYETLFSNKEMIFFKTMDELADQLNELVKNPLYRQQIAEAGYKKYYALFNEKKVARYIEQVAFDRLDDRAYEWPTLLTC